MLSLGNLTLKIYSHKRVVILYYISSKVPNVYIGLAWCADYLSCSDHPGVTLYSLTWLHSLTSHSPCLLGLNTSLPLLYHKTIPPYCTYLYKRRSLRWCNVHLFKLQISFLTIIFIMPLCIVNKIFKYN